MRNEVERFIGKLVQSITNNTYVCINVMYGDRDILRITTQIDDFIEVKEERIEITYKTNILILYLEQMNIEYDGTEEYFCFEDKELCIDMCFI